MANRKESRKGIVSGKVLWGGCLECLGNWAPAVKRKKRRVIED